MSLTVHIITPERSLPPAQADHVTLPAFDGEVGIRPQHAAYLCQLGAGTLRLRSDTQADADYALQGGVAQVADDEIRILAESVIEAGAVDEAYLVTRLQELDAADYDDGLALAEAKAEANWIITQLKSAGKTLPALTKMQ